MRWVCSCTSWGLLLIGTCAAAATDTEGSSDKRHGGREARLLVSRMRVFKEGLSLAQVGKWPCLLCTSAITLILVNVEYDPSEKSIIPICLQQGRDKDVVESLARWVADEYLDKRKEEVDTSSWQRRYLRVHFVAMPHPSRGANAVQVCGMYRVPGQWLTDACSRLSLVLAYKGVPQQINVTILFLFLPRSSCLLIVVWFFCVGHTAAAERQ